MTDTAAETAATKAHHSVILIAAIVQGWSLYGLYFAIENKVWPATDTAWLLALGVVAVLVPATVQLLARHVGGVGCWIAVGAMTAALFYFGWHHGTRIAVGEVANISGDLVAYVCVLLVFWLMLLPFLQMRLRTGAWKPDYRLLFELAWRNKFLLAEAGLFTAMFWMLLFLWAALFKMLDIGFFGELFSSAIFAYPVTALAFGIALRLIGSSDRWVAAVLEQSLSIFKWLAVVTALILVLFSIALLAKLPTVVFTGQRAISAAALLWLVATVILFLNAAYRDGTVPQPYPLWIGRALKWSVPLTALCAGTALYAIGVRVDQYGLTVERVWALVVAGVAVLYAAGYSATAFASRWLPSMAPVNIGVALVLLVVLAAMQTPLLSPYRLAADSQYRMALRNVEVDAGKEDGETNDAFHYLRFDAGSYGTERLAALAALTDHPQAPRIRARAESAQRWKNRYRRQQAPEDVAALVDRLEIFPAGRKLDAALSTILQKDLSDRNALDVDTLRSQSAFGLFVDMNGDGQEEFVLLTKYLGRLYWKVDVGWEYVGPVQPSGHGAKTDVRSSAASGDFSVATPPWQELRIGASVLTVAPRAR